MPISKKKNFSININDVWMDFIKNNSSKINKIVENDDGTGYIEFKRTILSIKRPTIQT